MSAFFATMSREWFGIDRLRLDKFYLVSAAIILRQMLSLLCGCVLLQLIRRMVRESFHSLQRSGWNTGYVRVCSACVCLTLPLTGMPFELS